MSLFVRSRWFRPPLDGHDGRPDVRRRDVDGPEGPQGSLLPSGQLLDLFVTLTDYYGYQELVQIAIRRSSTSSIITTCCISLSPRSTDGRSRRFQTRQCREPAPRRARATSSFPAPSAGADRDGRGGGATAGQVAAREFIAKFPGHLRAEIDPATASFLDGSVLNNRPFLQAIAAIHGRPAYREVDRRLVYIDPHPAPLVSPRRQPGSGLLRDAARRARISRARSR